MESGGSSPRIMKSEVCTSCWACYVLKEAPEQDGEASSPLQHRFCSVRAVLWAWACPPGGGVGGRFLAVWCLDGRL